MPCRNTVSSPSAMIIPAAPAQNCDRVRRDDRFAQQHIALILGGCNAEAFFANLKCRAYGQFHGFRSPSAPLPRRSGFQMGHSGGARL